MTSRDIERWTEGALVPVLSTALYPVLTRVPMILVHPGRRRAGHANDWFASTHDVAPTLLELLGFPASAEMPGAARETRIPTYGPRNASSQTTKVDQEYYDNLKSLGYIK